jgi:glycosyltransferase involved in cell wall biosynthesis
MDTKNHRRVLVFGMEFPPSATGSATYAYRLAAGLSDRGVEVKVLAPAASRGDGTAFDETQPFEVIRLPYAPFVPLRYLVARRWLKRIMVQYDPDLLWTTNGMASRVAGLISIPARIRLISSIRGSDILRRMPGKAISMRLESVPQRRCYRKSRAIGAASEYLKSVAVAKGVPAEKIFVAPSAVDLDQLESLGDGPPEREYPFLAGKRIILTVARLVAQKRVDLVVRAFAEIAHGFPDSCLVLVGDGPERAAIENLISSTGLAPRIHLLGRVEPMSISLVNLYRGADLFMMLGVEEGLPNVFIEAGALGLASIGANSGGTPEILQHNETGLLAAEDDVRDAAKQLRRLLENGQLREKLGSGARGRVVDRFSLTALGARSCLALEAALSGSVR